MWLLSSLIIKYSNWKPPLTLWVLPRSLSLFCVLIPLAILFNCNKNFVKWQSVILCFNSFGHFVKTVTKISWNDVGNDGWCGTSATQCRKHWRGRGAAAHGSYRWIIILEKCGRPGINVFHIKGIIGNHGNWKNQNPEGRFAATELGWNGSAV